MTKTTKSIIKTTNASLKRSSHKCPYHFPLKGEGKSKYATLFSLYIAQSIPMSFFSTVMPVIMRQNHYSLESIGLLQLIKLPWILKFLWAPMVDNRTRSKKQLKRWIIGSELFYAAVILCIGLFNLQTDFKIIIVLLVIAFIASATQDIATDIFAIYILKKEERCFGNSIQSGGNFIGTLFGTGFLLIAYHFWGWTGLVIGLAAFVVFAIIPAICYKGEVNFQKHEEQRISLKDIGTYFKNKKLRRRTWLLIFYYSGMIGILTMLKPYLVDLGYNAKEIGFMSGIVGTSAATLATFTAGFIIHKIGKTKAFYLFWAMGFLTAVYYYFLPSTPSLGQVYTAICLLWGSYGLSTVVIYTSSMDAVRQYREGTDFTLQIVLTHLSSIIIAIISGKIAHNLGYHGLFKIEIIIGIIALGALLFVVPMKISSSDNNKKLKANS